MINRIMCWFRGHKWVFQFNANVFEHSGSKRPLYVKKVFVCSNCLKTKKLKL